jgi:hypothetical protein
LAQNGTLERVDKVKFDQPHWLATDFPPFLKQFPAICRAPKHGVGHHSSKETI